MAMTGRHSSSPAMGRFDLRALLEAVEQFGSASLGLLAWEFMLAEVVLEPAWQLALKERLLRPVGHDPPTGEPMYTLTLHGRARLRQLRRNRRPGT
jgi:hypothetical protein